MRTGNKNCVDKRVKNPIDKKIFLMKSLGKI